MRMWPSPDGANSSHILQKSYVQVICTYPSHMYKSSQEDMGTATL